MVKYFVYRPVSHPACEQTEEYYDHGGQQYWYSERLKVCRVDEYTVNTTAYFGSSQGYFLETQSHTVHISASEELHDDLTHGIVYGCDQRLQASYF